MGVTVNCVMQISGAADGTRQTDQSRALWCGFEIHHTHIKHIHTHTHTHTHTPVCIPFNSPSFANAVRFFHT